MRVLVECIWEAEVQPEEGDTVYERGQYWLWYFGTDYKIIDLGDDRIAAVNYTTAICESCNTGQIECFRPEQLRIIGRQIKE
jgi:hypothetical protein